MKKPILELNQVSKIYLAPRVKGLHTREVITALNGITLTVEPGERLGVIGRNGAGKTTLLRVIGGTINLTNGSVRRSAFPRMVLSMHTTFLPHYTGRENIYLYASFLGLLRKEVDALLPAIIAVSGLGDVIDEPLRNYSNGMVMRLGFAVATAGNPALICLDEVLMTGDQYFQTTSLERMKELSQKGTTMIITHHGLELLSKFATRLIWLENGAIKMDGDPLAVRTAYENS